MEAMEAAKQEGREKVGAGDCESGWQFNRLGTLLGSVLGSLLGSFLGPLFGMLDNRGYHMAHAKTGLKCLILEGYTCYNRKIGIK